MGQGDRGEARGERGEGETINPESRIPSPESRVYFAIVTVQVPCCTASRGVSTIRLR